MDISQRGIYGGGGLPVKGELVAQTALYMGAFLMRNA